MRTTYFIASILSCAAFAGCGGSGSTAGTGGASTTSGTGGTGGESSTSSTSSTSTTTSSTGTGTPCNAGEMVDCYDGPAATKGVGLCTGGKKTCDASGQSFGACEGQVLPAAAESCTKAVDANCDGTPAAACSGTLAWVDHFGGTEFMYEAGVALDAASNSVVVGDFGGTVDFGGGGAGEPWQQRRCVHRQVRLDG